MKLKEWLEDVENKAWRSSEDAAPSGGEADDVSWKYGDQFTAGYMAGFNTARELAQEEFKATLKKYSGIPFHDAFKLVVEDLGKVGEEEV